MATIIFDFDDTLHNTKKLKEDINNTLLLNGIKETDVINSYQMAREDLNYTFEKHLTILNTKYPNLDIPTILKQLDSLFEKQYTFKNTKEILEKLQESHKLILLTNGEENTQNRKIDNSKLRKYFSEIHITQNNKIHVLKKMHLIDEIYFINDKEEENTEVSKHFPHFKIIEIKKGESLSIPQLNIL